MLHRLSSCFPFRSQPTKRELLVRLGCRLSRLRRGGATTVGNCWGGFCLRIDGGRLLARRFAVLALRRLYFGLAFCGPFLGFATDG